MDSVCHHVLRDTIRLIALMELASARFVLLTVRSVPSWLLTALCVKMLIILHLIVLLRFARVVSTNLPMDLVLTVISSVALASEELATNALHVPMELSCIMDSA